MRVEAVGEQGFFVFLLGRPISPLAPSHEQFRVSASRRVHISTIALSNREHANRCGPRAVSPCKGEAHIQSRLPGRKKLCPRCNGRGWVQPAESRTAKTPGGRKDK